AVPVRAKAEPYLNSWAAKLLGLPSRLRCLVERIDPSSSQVLETKEIKLLELGLAPLDFIYAAEGNRDGQPSELELRILHAIKRKADGFAPDALLRINPGRGTGWGALELGYAEFTELLRAAQRLITSSRAIDGSELDLPELNQPPALNIPDLLARADAAELALKQAATDLQAQIAAAAVGALELLRAAILRAAHFGVPGAVPSSAAGETTADRDRLLFQAGSVIND